jgi:hypothetical protein
MNAPDPRKQKYFDLVEAGVPRCKAAAEVGINERTGRKWACAYRATPGSLQSVPDEHYVKSTSTLIDDQGVIKMQWVKTDLDRQVQEARVQAWLAGSKEELTRADPVPPPEHTLSELANCYVISDFHMGMLAWHEETRDADWDLGIAKKLLLDWFDRAIAMSPDAELGIFVDLADFAHWDGMDAVTPASRHLLDADTRFQKLVRAMIYCKREIVRRLLQKHKRLIIIRAEGNHDPATSIHEREWLAAMYESEPRVFVDVSPDPYYCIEHGKTALFFHHGHKCDMSKIETVFIAKFREIFGRTKHTYAHMGHKHHIDIKEKNTMVIEQHRTLAPSDAYASRGGWISGRDAQVITYHKEHGEVGRLRISPSMLG